MSKRAERLRTTKLSETHFRDELLLRTVVLGLFPFFDSYPLGSKKTPGFRELPEHT
jgi:hypothetical protein